MLFFKHHFKKLNILKMKKRIALIAVFIVFRCLNIDAQDVIKATPGSQITVQNGAAIYVNGGFNADNTSLIKNNGIITVAKAGIGSADFTDNTSIAYTYGTGKFVFTGTGTQNITSINQFEKIEVDDAGLNLLSDIKSNNWYFKLGTINTGSFNAIVTSTLANSVQADVSNINFINSWVNGNLRRYITPAIIDNYPFPVGDATRVNMAELDNLIANPITGVTYVTASFGPKPGNDAGLNVSEMGTPYTMVNNRGVWYIVPDSNPSGGLYDMKLFLNGFTGLVDNSFGILRRPDASSNAVDWIVPAGSLLPTVGSPGRIVSSGYARRNNISSFSQFGIGTSLLALPVDLLRFYAVKKDKNVLLQWATSNEINTSHFELYKASQPSSLRYFDKVLATGSPNTNSAYEYTDVKPLKGLNFYRLKMFDKNNSYKLSQVIKINFDDINTLSVYPNPVTNNILYVDYNGGKIKEFILITADGKQLACSFIMQMNNQLKVTLPSLIAKGTYTVRINSDDGLRHTKILVQ